MSPGSGKAKGKGKKKHPKKKKHHVKAKNPKKVNLTNCVATPDWLDLSKKHGDTALWSGDGVGYWLTFAVSPFRKTKFRVKPNGTTPSGPIKGTAGYGDYKYSVAGDNGCSNDPTIHIGP
jgi:hypothetical protein